MDDDLFHVSLSAAEASQIAQTLQMLQRKLLDGQMICQPLGRFWTVEDRCQYRWPLATPEHRRRVRDVFVARFRERLGRYPLKLTGHSNAPFIVEEENLPILDRAIDIVRGEAEARERMPLFARLDR